MMVKNVNIHIYVFSQYIFTTTLKWTVKKQKSLQIKCFLIRRREKYNVIILQFSHLADLTSLPLEQYNSNPWRFQIPLWTLQSRFSLFLEEGIEGKKGKKPPSLSFSIFINGGRRWRRRRRESDRAAVGAATEGAEGVSVGRRRRLSFRSLQSRAHRGIPWKPRVSLS